jgi:hypothetical protein
MYPIAQCTLFGWMMDFLEKHESLCMDNSGDRLVLANAFAYEMSGEMLRREMLDRDKPPFTMPLNWDETNE